MPGPVLKLVGDPRPELLLDAQLAIEGLVHPGSRVLEFGSGHSTIWFAKMGCGVTSIENNQDWFMAVKGWLAERDLKAVMMLQSPSTFATAAFGLDDVFDLVFVDGAHGQYRMDCLRASKDKIRPGGWAVLDDSHWHHWKGTPELLKGWTRVDFSGVHLRLTGISKKTRTSIYQRPK